MNYNSSYIKELSDELDIACCRGDFEKVLYLVSKGVDITANDNSALEHASKQNYGVGFLEFPDYFKIIRFLILRGADPRSRESSCLSWVCKKQHFELVRFLVEKGSNINAKGKNAFLTCVEYWETKLNCKIMNYLIEKGADISQGNNYALKYASQQGHLKKVKLLVEKGGEIDSNMLENVINQLRDPLVQFQVKFINNFFKVIKFFIEQGVVPVNGYNNLLATACSYKKFPLAKLLIQKGANSSYANEAYHEFIFMEKYWKKWRRGLVRRWAIKLLPVFYSPDFTGGKLGREEFLSEIGD